MAKQPNDLFTRLGNIVGESALPFVKGWIETLGKVGQQPKKGQKDDISPHTRIAAAKTGIELVTKFVGNVGGSAAGESLLNELQKLEKQVEDINADTEETEGEE